MNKFVYIFILFALITSCKKESKKMNFGNLDYQSVLLNTTLISHGGGKLKFKIDFVSLDSNAIDNDMAQGTINQSDLVFSFPDNTDYSFQVSNFQQSTVTSESDYSALILIDKTSGGYDFDGCLVYSMKAMQGKSEIAFGGFSDVFGGDGYKIYGSGMINKDSDHKFDGLSDAISDPLEGSSNALTAIYNAIDYLTENANNNYKHLIVYSFGNLDENQPLVDQIVQKAQLSNVKISIIGRHNYDLIEISKRTNGFYSYINYLPKLISLSIDKILTHQYVMSSIDMTITSTTSTFNTFSRFGYFLQLRNLKTDKLSRLYYYVHN